MSITPPLLSREPFKVVGDLSSQQRGFDVQQDPLQDSLPVLTATKIPKLGPEHEPHLADLIHAIENRDLEAAKLLLGKDMHVNGIYQGRDEVFSLGWGCTPLQKAVINKCTSMLTFLLRNDASVDLRTSDTPRPINVACGLGELEAVKVLVEYGAFIDLHENDDLAPIHAALASGSAELVNYLCRIGANMETRTVDSDHTPLELACTFIEPYMVALLLENGAKPLSSYKPRSWIARPRILYSLSPAVLDKLVVLDRGLFVPRNGLPGSSAVQEILSGKHFVHDSQFIANFRLLLRRFPEQVSLPNAEGNTPLHTAAANMTTLDGDITFSEQIFQALVDAGANIDAKNDFGHDPLYLACLRGREAAIKALLKCGASVIPRSALNSHYNAVLLYHFIPQRFEHLVGLLDAATAEQSCPANAAKDNLDSAGNGTVMKENLNSPLRCDRETTSD